jgi:signal transduction histidine kinase
LDLAKVEGKKYAICRRHVSVRRLVEEYVASAIPLAEQKGVALESRWHEPECKIFADAEAVEKIVGTLLGNALKFTPAGGEISIQGTNVSDGGVHFVVRDTGVGISEGKLDAIFDRFAQVDSTATRRFEGTGIGLSLVKELVSLHGGRVWAESEGAGSGAEIHVALPVGNADERLENLVVACGASSDLDDGSTSVERVQGLGVELGDRDLSMAEIRRNLERADSSSPLGGRPILEHPQGAQTVLVGDDNRDMRRLLSHLLSKEFCVETAANGRDGLDAARRIRPDLVLTDVMMPEMSGTDLCEALKSDPATRATPVVLVTSKADREMKIKGLELGADDYVTKPFHPKELIARVRSLLRVTSLQREVSVKNARLESVNEELSQTLIDLKGAESALVQAERLAAVGELAAGIAHEVNNPVNFATNALRTLRVYVGEINGIASRIEKLDVSDFDRVRSQIVELDAAMKEAEFAEVVDSLDELVGIVTEGLGRTARLVNDLQRFGSPANDDVGAVDLGACIRSTIDLVRYSARDCGVMLHSDVDSGLPHIHGSAQSLSQVLLNLVKNAIEAVSVRRGNVWVRAKEIDGSVVVEVSDDGPGVDVEIVDQLFDPFVTTKPPGDGTGLGLAISRRVVSDHNGEIRVSRSLVGGARFEVLFPIFPVTMREENAAEA